MAPALAPALIAREAAACAAMGVVLGSVRALLPVKGRAAFLPDLLFVGTVLLGLQSYAAALSAGGVLRWYMLASAFFCAFAAEKLLRRPLAALERAVFWLLSLPLRLVQKLAAPLFRRAKQHRAEARQRRAAKRTAKKQKKNLPSTQRMLYNSNVSK